LMAELEGRVAVITGANQGLGEAIARAFLQAGASLFLCARDEARLTHVRDELRRLCKTEQRVETLRVDVAQRDDVQRLAAAALGAFPNVHILVNNAGVYGPLGKMEEVDWDDWVRAIEVDLLGPVLVARGFLPHLRAQSYGKIIQISGGGASAPLPYISAYAAAKAGVVRVMETLAEEVKDDRIDVNSIAPGPLNTRLLDELLSAGPEKVGRAFYDRAVQQKAEGGAGFDKAARLAVFLASAASDGLTGKLVSALWDPWEQFPAHLPDLLNSDVYSLRRILPKERGFGWG
jgi:NAD(P)-dependent dehydrogenase (short-subunit alcohol dehydrogenase family)